VVRVKRINVAMKAPALIRVKFVIKFFS